VQLVAPAATATDIWDNGGRPLSSLDPETVMDVDELYAAGDRVQILDVRDQQEWDEQRITGSQHVVYHDAGRVIPPLDRDRPVAVICTTGRRSAMAVGLVRRSGFAEVIHVTDGGVGTWAARGYPVEQSQPAAV